MTQRGFRRQTSSKWNRSARLAVEQLERREVLSTITGPSSSATPYLLPTAAGVDFTSIMTVGDSVNMKPDGVTPYRAVGIMDGMGAYDNGNGTFTLVMNHEIGGSFAAGAIDPAGGVRAHGNEGAFVSIWTIRKSDLKVLKVEDLLQTTTSIFLSNNVPHTGTPHTGYLPASTTVIQRLCSADLAPISAYSWIDPTTGTFYGTTARIFQTGEESGSFATSVTGGGTLGEARVEFGRQWNMILTDDPNTIGVNEARTAYEMPHCGLFAWENNLASPYSQRKTVVMGMDDSSPFGQVYVWVGDKQTSGSVVERAGLVRVGGVGDLYGIKVAGVINEAAAFTGNSFTLANLGDVSGLTAGALETLSDANAVTEFLRPEDGQWDPNNPNDYYFVTTASFTGPSRLHRLRFADITNPAAGGTITTLIDGAVGGHKMFDNMTVDQLGRIILQEDPGNQSYLARVWIYDIASGALLEIGKHDPARFGTPTPPFSQDEESSGVIDMADILGPGTYLLNVQAHYNPGVPELVEGGQLLMMRLGVTSGIGYNAADNTPALVVLGTERNDRLGLSQHGDDFVVTVRGQAPVQFTGPVDKIFALGYDGNDNMDFEDVETGVMAWGGAGNDDIDGGDGDDYLNGGDGNDDLQGSWGDDAVVGGNGNDDVRGGQGADVLQGGFGNDYFYYDDFDLLVDFGVGKDKKKKV